MTRHELDTGGWTWGRIILVCIAVGLLVFAALVAPDFFQKDNACYDSHGDEYSQCVNETPTPEVTP